VRKRSVGQARARAKVHKLLGPEQVQFHVINGGTLLMLAWLDYIDCGITAHDDPGEQQPHIVVRVLLTSKRHHHQITAFTFVASDHAVGRLIQRSAPKTDYAKAIMQAHSALMRANWQSFEAALDDDKRFLLPAADGQFICQAKLLCDENGEWPALLARGVTWISEDMRHERQDVIELEGDPTGAQMLGVLLTWKDRKHFKQRKAS
jgi:hypothetical protein